MLRYWRKDEAFMLGVVVTAMAVFVMELCL